MAKERFRQEFGKGRPANATDLHDLRRRILAMLKVAPMKGADIETALMEFSNHTAIRRAIRYAFEDKLITRDRPSQPWSLKKQ